MTRYTVPHADPRRRADVLTAEGAPEAPTASRWSPAELLPPGCPRSPVIVPAADRGIPVVSIIRGAASDR
ncbi:hypothetical protein [Virgisporangium aurantiacum]|uniref:Uncharacterized protein n=1 Tax=Virgisporangium aurantiacum TaxID=175570 RepID=A0A8J4DZF4_9ACTN|nr:hypothetical protein [Virgisporangium aurantiacum]GIJ55483.1 hypothetical protein Vau01_029990 [Virgisporangium aurantiacum]